MSKPQTAQQPRPGVVPQTFSQNWKALAPLIKGQKGKVSQQPSTPPTSIEQDGDGKKNVDDLWFEVDEISLRRSEAEAKLAKERNQHPHREETSNDWKTRNGLLSSLIREMFARLTHGEANHRQEPGRYVAMDCEMVGVGPDGVESALARVSMVNWHGEVLLDQYVRPAEHITDFRTEVSGIKPHHVRDAPPLAEVQRKIWPLLKDKILIGHGLENDFRVLLLNHPRRLIRDTSRYHLFRKLALGRTPSLKRLAKDVLGLEIQEDFHDSVDDARVAMLLYRTKKDDWENYIFRGEGKHIKEQQRPRKKDKSRPKDLLLNKSDKY